MYEIIQAVGRKNGSAHPGDDAQSWEREGAISTRTSHRTCDEFKFAMINICKRSHFSNKVQVLNSQ
jgi:hypothetical protein